MWEFRPLLASNTTTPLQSPCTDNAYTSPHVRSQHMISICRMPKAGKAWCSRTIYLLLDRQEVIEGKLDCSKHSQARFSLIMTWGEEDAQHLQAVEQWSTRSSIDSPPTNGPELCTDTAAKRRRRSLSRASDPCRLLRRTSSPADETSSGREIWPWR